MWYQKWLNPTLNVKVIILLHVKMCLVSHVCTSSCCVYFNKWLLMMCLLCHLYISSSVCFSMCLFQHVFIPSCVYSNMCLFHHVFIPTWVYANKCLFLKCLFHHVFISYVLYNLFTSSCVFCTCYGTKIAVRQIDNTTCMTSVITQYRRCYRSDTIPNAWKNTSICLLFTYK